MNLIFVKVAQCTINTTLINFRFCFEFKCAVPLFDVNVQWKVETKRNLSNKKFYCKSLKLFIIKMRLVLFIFNLTTIHSHIF